MKRQNIKITGKESTWYVIDEMNYYGRKLYLLENEEYGDEMGCLIVDSKLNIILDDVWCGFDELYYI